VPVSSLTAAFLQADFALAAAVYTGKTQHPACSASIWKSVQISEREGVVAKDAGGRWVFQRDHLFRAPGVAAMVTFGVAKSGNAWSPVTRPRVLAMMARHGIEVDPEALSQFGSSDFPQEAALVYDQSLSRDDDASPRIRHLRTHALQELAPGARNLGGGAWET